MHLAVELSHSLRPPPNIRSKTDEETYQVLDRGYGRVVNARARATVECDVAVAGSEVTIDTRTILQGGVSKEDQGEPPTLTNLVYICTIHT